MILDYQQMVDALTNLLASPALLEDRDFELIAYGTQSGPIDRVRSESILLRRCSAEARTWLLDQGIETSAGPLRTTANHELGLTSRLCIPARHEGRTHGYLWVLDRDLDDAALDQAISIAERAGRQLAEERRLGRRVEDALRVLLSTSVDHAESAVRQFADLTHLRPDDPIVVFKLVHRDEAALTRAMAAARGGRRWLARMGGLEVGVLATGTTLADGPARAALADALLADTGGAEPGGAQIAVSAAAPLRLAGRCWDQAGVALLSGTRSEPGGSTVADWSDLGVRRLLGVVQPQALALALDLPAVEALVNDPKAAQLVETASVYLDCGGSAKRASDLLHIHRQSLYYRLGMVEERTGLDLAKGSDRVLLHLALMLFRRTPVESGPPRS